jgi:hypothetical protein
MSTARARDLIARHVLEMGDIRMSGTMPSGHDGILMPERMYFIDDTTAALNDEDLGHPSRVNPNPQIGQVSLPARGVLAVGQATWRIRDTNEYARTRAEAERDA